MIKKYKKIRVFGPCGSGKSYLSKDLTTSMNIDHYETDNMIWNRIDNVKYSRENRNKNLNEVLKKASWLIEGAQYKWSFESFEEADLIIFIDPNPLRLYSRIVLRFVKMQINPREFNYRQSFGELIEMIEQTREYYRSTRHDFLKRVKDLPADLMVIKNSVLEIE